MNPDNIEPEKLKPFVDEAIERIKNGAEIPLLLNEYKEKLSMTEAFWVLVQARMKAIIPEKFHDFNGRGSPYTDHDK